jgi:hypothetical protein
MICHPEPDHYGVGTAPPYCRRSAEWTRATHEKFLAVESRSLLKTDNHPSTPGRSDEVFRNLSTILERQATVATTPPPSKTGFDSFPPATKKMTLFTSERGTDGEKPSAPVSSFAELLALSNVAYVQNHIQNFLLNTKGRDAFIPMGLCAAIRTASFISDASDRPGAFSLFCCGPQVLDRSTAGNRESYDYTNNLVQMQLKTTDTTTGFSDKDIKTMTKLSFTAPRDFHKLARLVENMAGITEILFGARSPLTDMLYDWRHFLTRAVGSTRAHGRNSRLQTRMVHRPTNATIFGTLHRGRQLGGDQPIAPGLPRRTPAAGRRSLRVPCLRLPPRQARERSQTETRSDYSHARWLDLKDEQTRSAGR